MVHNFTVTPSTLRGEISIPPSKSQTLRALTFGLLAKGTTTIHNYLCSPDTHALIKACQNLGAKVFEGPNYLKITGLNGQIETAQDVIDVGNSGINLRFLASIAALSKNPIVITGDQSIRTQRSLKPLLEALSQLNVSAISTRNNGYAPIIIQGPLHAGKATFSGEDSQPVSGLLIASSFASGETELHVENPGEKPWVDLTLSWLNKFNIPFQRKGYSYYKLFGNAAIHGFDYTVPGDLSTLAFPLAAAVITNSELVIKNVDMSDLQGDKIIISILQSMGASIEHDRSQNALIVRKRSKTLQGCSIEINDCIDALPILAVIGCFAEGETVLKNAEVARKKECDRLQCITKELKKMGADIIESPDELRIKKSSLKGADMQSHGDHRLAMALTVASFAAKGISSISSVECIAKTYPNFKNQFDSIGANICETYS